MKCLPRLLCPVASGCVWMIMAVPGARAADSTAQGAVNGHPVLSGGGAPAQPPPSRARAISPEMSARLKSLLPEMPPVSRLPAPVPPPEPPSRLEADPQHPILVLPEYHVREDRPPAFKERDLLTPEARYELALRRHPGLRLNGKRFYNWGEEMLQEEFAKERQQEMADMLGLLPAGNTAGKRTVRNLRVKAKPPVRTWADTGGSWAEKQRGGPRGVP